jgi:hypothetical protein
LAAGCVNMGESLQSSAHRSLINPCSNCSVREAHKGVFRPIALPRHSKEKITERLTASCVSHLLLASGRLKGRLGTWSPKSSEALGTWNGWSSSPMYPFYGWANWFKDLPIIPQLTRRANISLFLITLTHTLIFSLYVRLLMWYKTELTCQLS